MIVLGNKSISEVFGILAAVFGFLAGLLLLVRIIMLFI